MKYLLIFLNIFVLINSKTTNEDIIISFYSPYGSSDISDENGVLALNSNYEDSNDLFDSNDIEEKTAFQMDISGSSKVYPLKCRLTKITKKAINLLCRFEGPLEKNETISIDKPYNFQYKTHNVQLNFNVKDLSLYKVSYKVPFLYSAEQEFNIQENQNKINLEFKYESYNNEQLVIMNNGNMEFAALENCKKDSKILICEILRGNLDKISKPKNTYNLFYFHDIIGQKDFQYIPEINVNYLNIVKEDVYLKIEKPVYTQIESASFITFPTNITNLPTLKTGYFLSKISDESFLCFLIKHNEKNPLYFLCNKSGRGNFTISNYEGFNKSDIHYKYNFILNPGRMDVTVTFIDGDNHDIGNRFPDIMDFSKADSFKMYLKMGTQNPAKNIRLNEAGNDLECEDKKETKVCKVPKSHFNGAKSGHYFIRHKSDAVGDRINYETFSVNVVLQGNKGSKLFSCPFFLFGLLSLILI